MVVSFPVPLDGTPGDYVWLCDQHNRVIKVVKCDSVNYAAVLMKNEAKDKDLLYAGGVYPIGVGYGISYMPTRIVAYREAIFYNGDFVKKTCRWLEYVADTLDEIGDLSSIDTLRKRALKIAWRNALTDLPFDYYCLMQDDMVTNQELYTARCRWRKQQGITNDNRTYFSQYERDMVKPYRPQRRKAA